MGYQAVIDGLTVTAISCLIWAMLCFIGIGIATHKRDKQFEKSQQEYNEKLESINKK